MIPHTAISALYLASVANAHFGRFQPRMVAAEECCPCPGSDAAAGDAQEPVTVTVTEVATPEPVTLYVSHHSSAASASTVTVHSTITKAPLTVYVTTDDPQPSGSDPANAEDQVDGNKDQEQGGKQDSTGSQDPNDEGSRNMGDPKPNEAPKDEQRKFVVPETLLPVVPVQETPKTVTVSIAPAESPVPVEDKTVTILPSQEKLVVTTVPGAEELPKDTVVAPPTNPTALVSPEPVPTSPPSIETVSVVQVNNATITVAPSAEPVTQIVNNTFQTITQTVHNGDNIDVQITVVNIETGDKTCVVEATGVDCDIIYPPGNSTDPLPPVPTPEEPCPPATNPTSSGFSTNTFRPDEAGAEEGPAAFGLILPKRLRARKHHGLHSKRW